MKLAKQSKTNMRQRIHDILIVSSLVVIMVAVILAAFGIITKSECVTIWLVSLAGLLLGYIVEN